MQDSLEAMKVALRVLTAYTNRVSPDPMDVDRLKALAPHSADEPVDELACEVIQQSIKQRAEIKAKRAGR